eukprot:gene3900-963_t
MVDDVVWARHVPTDSAKRWRKLPRRPAARLSAWFAEAGGAPVSVTTTRLIAAGPGADKEEDGAATTVTLALSLRWEDPAREMQ